jgi:hypothetical protein
MIIQNSTNDVFRQHFIESTFEHNSEPMKISPLLFLAFILFSIESSAQFMIGWNAGYGNARELNREIYIYDAINRSGLKKEMKEVHWNQGPAIGFRAGGDGGFLELIYSRKKAMVSSTFDSASVPFTRQMKVYSNTWNLGFGMNKSGWGIGMSFDFGRFKGFGRRGPEDGIKDVAWKRLWVLDRTRLLGIAVARLYITETFFVERKVGIFSVRLYAQLFGMREQLDGLDSWLFGADLNYAMPSEEHFNNYGIAVFINLGKK